MKQFTVKRVVEALRWLHENPHHIVGAEHREPYTPGQMPKAMYYQNHFEKMRVPGHLIGEVSSMIRANRRKFDTRMYALTAKGKRLIGEA